MRKAFFACLLAVAACAAWSQPKIAVLDTVVPQSIDQSVIIPTTEKIIERLVVSGRYTVLDRANIESVLKEREFQLSGMVSDQDVVTAGKYLGADFVVVAKVQKVSDTYFISAKMINIKTGVIANQTSAQGEGKLSKLIELSEQVGDVLSGGAVTAQSSVGGQRDISKPDTERQAEPARPKANSTSSATARPAKKTSLLLGGGIQGTAWIKEGSGSFPGTWTESYPYMTAYAGLDLRYITLGASFGLGLEPSYKDATYSTYTQTNSGSLEYRNTYAGVEIMGKLPIALGGITLFPEAGIEYEMNLGVTDGSGASVSISDTYLTFWSRLYLLAGIGADLRFGDSLFARLRADYGFKLAPSSYDDYISAYDATTYGYDSVAVLEGTLKLSAAIGFSL